MHLIPIRTHTHIDHIHIDHIHIDHTHDLRRDIAVFCIDQG